MDNFAKHVASYRSFEQDKFLIEHIVWAESGNSNYYMEFLTAGLSLSVSGDAYEGIYAASQRHTLAWWANTDAHYMGQKLRDLDGYADNRKKWCYNEAEKDLDKMYAELVKEVREDGDYEVPEAAQKDGPEWEAFLESLRDREYRDGSKGLKYRVRELYHWVINDPRENIEDNHSWIEFCREHGDDVFSDPWYETAGSVGMIPHPQIAFHNEALKAAVKQLRDRGVVLPN